MNKKIIFCVILLITIIIGCGIIIYYQNYYSVEEIIALLKENEWSNNIKVVETYFDDNNNQIAHFDYYIKDNMIYISQYDNNHKYAESLTKVNNYNISIVHDEKQILRTADKTEKMIGTGELHFLHKVDQSAVYKCYGKEVVDNKNCVKVSLYIENIDNVELTYYYINLEDNYIIKEENYIGTSMEDISFKDSVTYEYTYNCVSDNDILKFDVSNYKDYQYTEM